LERNSLKTIRKSNKKEKESQYCTEKNGDVVTYKAARYSVYERKVRVVEQSKCVQESWTALCFNGNPRLIRSSVSG
jgi:hypothetical protein